MTRSDILTAAAARTMNPIKINDREVVMYGPKKASITLHGKEIIVIDNGRLSVDGTTPPTRKSTRTINAVLAQFGPYRVGTKNKDWFLKTPEGGKLCFTGKLANITIN
ncbi:MAG: hypothetical protein IJ687_06155 [Bacteroidales bacterium]|nr:hypothetical protein [Bacteroidales bacterium]